MTEIQHGLTFLSPQTQSITRIPKRFVPLMTILCQTVDGTWH